MRKMIRLLMLAACLCWLPTALLQGQVYINYAVNQPVTLEAHAGVDELICPGQTATLGATPAATGGYGAYTYAWTPAATLNNASAANPVATPIVATTYILSLMDSLGCTDDDTIVIALDTCVGLQGQQAIGAFDVIPNPNGGQFVVNIRLNEPSDAIYLTVVDLSGKEVYAKQMLQPEQTVQQKISLDGLSRGVYFVRMESAGHLVSRKMILR
jgi:Secretion system C-terminal sorting domain